MDDSKIYRYPPKKVVFFPFLMLALSILFIFILLNGFHRHEVDRGVYGVIEIVIYVLLIAFCMWGSALLFFGTASVLLSITQISTVMFGRVVSSLSWAEVQSITRVRSAYYGDAREGVRVSQRAPPWWAFVPNLGGVITFGQELDGYAALKDELTAKAKEHGIPMLLEETGWGVRDARSGKKLVEPFRGLRPNEKAPIDHL